MQGSSTTMAEKPLAPAIDWQLSLKLAMGKADLAEEMLSMFMAELPKAQALIENAYQTQQWSELQMQVHKLHGATCYCGVPQLKSIVAKFETLLKCNNKTDIHDLYEQTNAEMARILKTYQSGNYK